MKYIVSVIVPIEFFYGYDDACNRIRKAIFENTDPEALPIINIDNPSGGWSLIYEVERGEIPIYREIYKLRGADGLELAIYKNNGSSYELVQYNIYAGGDNAGKLTSENAHRYYIKDHLGSVRVTIDTDRQVISANDYDPWGYYLDNRGYEQSPDFDSPLYMFTSKERDRESGYDYFGARYYDSRIGRWGSVDPLFEKHFNFSPYNHVLDNPLYYIDPDGRQLSSALKDLTIRIVGRKSLASDIIGYIPITPTDVVITILMGELGTMDQTQTVLTKIPNSDEYISNIEAPVLEVRADEIPLNVLLSENKTIKKQVEGLMDPVIDHLDKLEDSKKPSGYRPENENDWKKDLKKNWNNAKDKASKIGKSVEQILKERGWESDKIKSLLERIQKQGVE